MIKILRNDIEIKTITNIDWSGDYKQAGRSLSFSYTNLDKGCKVGDKIKFIKDDKILFLGQIYTVEYSVSQKIYNVTSFDLLNNLCKSRANGRFAGDISQICRNICNVFGLKSKVSLIGIAQEIITTGDYTYFDVIDKAIKKSLGDKKYNLRIENGNEVVLDVINDKTVAKFSDTTNILDSVYSESIENMVNRILIVDEDAVVSQVKENKQDVAKFGIFQDVEREVDTDEDNLKEKELKSVEYSASLNLMGNLDVKAGATVEIYEPTNKFIGKFFVLNDRHTITETSHIMTVGLSYEPK